MQTPAQLLGRIVAKIPARAWPFMLICGIGLLLLLTLLPSLSLLPLPATGVLVLTWLCYIGGAGGVEDPKSAGAESTDYQQGLALGYRVGARQAYKAALEATHGDETAVSYSAEEDA